MLSECITSGLLKNSNKKTKGKKVKAHNANGIDSWLLCTMVKQKRNHTLAAMNTADLLAIIVNTNIYFAVRMFLQPINNLFFLINTCFLATKKYCKIFLWSHVPYVNISECVLVKLECRILQTTA